MSTLKIEAMQFNGIDSYLKINDWMKECGDTNALAGENKYMTPIMLIHTPSGVSPAFPGDYVCKQENGTFFVLGEN